MKTKFLIKDWADNICFKGKEFTSFEDAWEYIYTRPELEHLDDDTFEEHLDEYYVEATCS